MNLGFEIKNIRSPEENAQRVESFFVIVLDYDFLTLLDSIFKSFATIILTNVLKSI